MKRSELRALLESRGLRPQHRFGQNFLIDPALLSAIPRDAGVQAGDRVLEVGPGAGALTQELLNVGANVFAVELDYGLFALMEDRFASFLESGQLQLVAGDVLGKDPAFHPEVESWWAAGTPPRVVANLPYSISGPFLGRLAARPLTGACLLLQSEMARKAASTQCGKEYGPLTVRLALAFHVELGRRPPPQVFWPRPKVDSAFLHLRPRADAPSASVGRALKEILQWGFAQRRKRLFSRLKQAFPMAVEALQAAGVEEDARAEVVTPTQWLLAAQAVDAEVLSSLDTPDSMKSS
ncbi:MAG: 16S rRNA (adenine(1518)-N(6)/adenine(1519)-N(6))-dimethyltransferase RsmA [Planctomycetota bacterium]|nr:16S rRNA (adenine(1518)-N(6)/adenine(1519)-N(6))-dimethyltransferase RsmA [Planctomycetota bacterium]